MTKTIKPVRTPRTLSYTGAGIIYENLKYIKTTQRTKYSAVVSS